MKKLLAALLVVISTQVFAQQDEILGVWMSENNDAKIKVYKNGGKYFGKLIWIAEDVGPDGGPKRDVNNPDPDKQDDRLLGKVILKGLEWDKSDDEWDDGEIYDPKSGNTYDLYARLEDKNTLYMKGYIGFSLIGRSTLWSRVE